MRNNLQIEQQLIESISKAIGSIEDDVKSGIYAYSIFTTNADDDPRRPRLILGYNTISFYKREIPNASSDLEAKWNYAFWPQNSIFSFGSQDADKSDSNQVITDWVSSIGLLYSDEDENRDFDACIEKGELIGEHFTAMLVRVVKTLQARNKYSIPILIHGLEYYDKTIDQNIQANGFELVKEFVNWIDNQ